ncbi:MAG: nitronate monooxygenase [Rhodospirillales bacterium]|nr:MAG: nitronate monooxygenase [Rhodospirillales bacterium]
MPLPEILQGRLRLPVIAAPMFLVSGPELLIACCKAGIVGTVPAANARPPLEFEKWVARIETALADAPGAAPWGANISVRRGNERLEADLDICVRHRIPVVITILGKPDRVVEAVHGYGGIVLHDAATERHARNAIAAGVDGIIALAGGAGGHTGWQNPFSLVREIRRIWDGCLILAGAISDGHAVRAAEVLGADLAYMGTRFTATRESMAPEAMKQMIVDCKATDILTENHLTGLPANYMIPSLEAAGIDVDKLRAGELPDAAGVEDSVKAWRDLWSAGHGVSVIDDVPPVSELVARLEREYRAACGVASFAR